MSTSFFDEHLPSEEQIRRSLEEWASAGGMRGCACLGPWLCVAHRREADRRFLAEVGVRWEE